MFTRDSNRVLDVDKRQLAGYCSNIQVILEEDGTATVRDNGRGIPTGINNKTGIPAVEMVFTMLHAGRCV